MDRILSWRTAFIVAFLVGFCGILLACFPVNSLELAIQNQINRRLSEPVKFTNFSLVSLFRYEGNAVASFRGERLNLPFQLRLQPGWTRFGLTVVSPHDAKQQDPFPFMATANVYKKTFTANAEKYPLDEVLSNQKGKISGRIQGTMNPPLNGEFRFTLSVPRLRESPVYPPFLYGLRINELTVKGSVDGRRISMKTIDLTSDKFLLNGSATITLKHPLKRTKVNLDVNVKQPIQKTMNQTFTLGNFGY